jgi:hypothetical protein
MLIKYLIYLEFSIYFFIKLKLIVIFSKRYFIIIKYFTILYFMDLIKGMIYLMDLGEIN